MVFIDHRPAAYDTIARDLIWYCLRRKNVPEAFIDIIKNMYEDSITLFSTTVGETGEIEIKIGLHQGSALSPFLSIIIKDVITEDIEEETPWTILFADDIALSGENCVQVEGRLELWRTRLEDMDLKLSRRKTEHLLSPGEQKNIKLKEYNSSKHAELPQCTGFKYLGITLHQDGGCEKEVELRISKAWNRRRELTCVLCDKRIPAKFKALIYKIASRPALLYGNETWPLTERLTEKVNSCEMRMLRYCIQISLLEHQRNGEITRKANVMPILDHMRKRRLEWFSHVCRGEKEDDIRRMHE